MPFSVRRFIEAERGSATVGGIFFTMATLSVTGLALDQANAWNVQTHLQVAADAAALAAATQINDFDAARALGIQTADANLKKSGVIGADDFVFGIWDATNMVFTSTDDEEAANAVRVTTDLDKAGGDAVPTYLLKFVGINYWNFNAGTIALAEPSAGAVEEPTSEPGNAFGALNCNMMTVISYGVVETGGGNQLAKGVCIHGQMGVTTGGNNHYDREVSFSAPHLEDIYIGSYGPNNIDEDDLKNKLDIEPMILPELDNIFADLWLTLYQGAPEQYFGDLLPDFFFESGVIDVVISEGDTVLTSSDVNPNTVYVINGDLLLEGAFDVELSAFIVNGNITNQTGDKDKIGFVRSYFLARNIDIVGSVRWGENGTQCKEDHFSVYLLSLNSLTMGGWGSEVSTNGVIGVAPRWYSAGNMKARNIYFETGEPGWMYDTSMGGDIETSLGGDLSINGNDCSFELSSLYPLSTRDYMFAGHEGRKARLLR